MAYDSTQDTQHHIEMVRKLIDQVVHDLDDRANVHDQSKYSEPEKATYDEFTPKLKGSTYGSDEYKGFLRDMGPALQHHYEHNDHHPEHFPADPEHKMDVHVESAWHPGGCEYTVVIASCDQCYWTRRGDESDVRDAAAQHTRENAGRSGIHAMNLAQMIEMLCDWKAASLRHADGDLGSSIRKNAERFGYGAEIENLLHQTAEAFGWL